MAGRQFDPQLIERPQRLLRVIPLPSWLTRRDRNEGEARGTGSESLPRCSHRHAICGLLTKLERRCDQLEELDVEGMLALAERILPRAADLWVQASLDQRQRFQQLFFPDGIALDGNRFVRTGATAPAFSYLRPIDGGNEGLVD